MSEVISSTPPGVLTNPQPQTSDAPRPGSLHARMRARAKELAAQKTEIFPVPGYAQVLAVEMCALELDTIIKIGERNERTREAANRVLHTAAEYIVAATVGFYEVDDDGERKSIDTSWQELAHGVLEHVPEDITPRMAVIALFGTPTTRLTFFADEFLAWANGERSSINDEVAQDFGTTR